MSDDATGADTGEIVVEELLPHSPEAIWRALTTGDLIARWLMAPTGFEPVKGTRFTFRTRPAGAWDGTIRCEVLDVAPNERLVYSWQGGDESNVGYGSALNTVVTWTLAREGKGTRLRLVHSGFVTPKNDSALKTMGEGWKKVVLSLGSIAGEQRDDR